MADTADAVQTGLARERERRGSQGSDGDREQSTVVPVGGTGQADDHHREEDLGALGDIRLDTRERRADRLTGLTAAVGTIGAEVAAETVLNGTLGSLGPWGLSARVALGVAGGAITGGLTRLGFWGCSKKNSATAAPTAETGLLESQTTIVASSKAHIAETYVPTVAGVAAGYWGGTAFAATLGLEGAAAIVAGPVAVAVATTAAAGALLHYLARASDNAAQQQAVQLRIPTGPGGSRV